MSVLGADLSSLISPYDQWEYDDSTEHVSKDDVVDVYRLKNITLN